MEVIIVLVIVVGIIGALLYFRSKEASRVATIEETTLSANAEPIVPVAVAVVSEPVVETPAVVETSTVVEITPEQPEAVTKPKRTRTKKTTVETKPIEEPKPAAKSKARKPKMTVAK